MLPYGVATVLFCFLSAVPTSTERDFRYISYNDLQLTVENFAEPGVTAYSEVLFDIARNQVFLGARDSLYKLSLHDLEPLERVRWDADSDRANQCIFKGQSEENCHNYIKILLTNGRELFACGTNGFFPMCSWRNLENISKVTRWVEGIAKCPYNPSANVTGYLSESGEYYFGGPMDFSGSQTSIAKETNGHVISTKQYDNFWLNEPQFVGSFETDRFIYFLFREAAVEYINCGKVVYSRIARVCKNDIGGRKMFKENWTTFVKARLNCSISGEYPFYFNEIQSMSYLPKENILYATFTTPENSIAGSAICAYNLSAIDAAFSGPFKHQDHSSSAWERHDMQRRDHLECRSEISGDQVLENSRYQLMDQAVQPLTLNPLHVAQLERFTHITVDVLSTKLHNSVHVIYASTTNSVIKKITVLPRTQETCIVEEWETMPDSQIKIRSMQFLKDTNSVYITSDIGLSKIPADHCRRHGSKESCINAMDPYCGWNERNESCTMAPNNEPLDKYWKQSVTSCPVTDTSIDGGWSSWSEWAPCVHRTSPDSNFADNCLCQIRGCNNPAPMNGGRPCIGQSIAVINCTVHGDWSDWSAWSACSATCGTALKTRRRTCTNPAPAHGGRVCVGQDRTEAFCTELPPCPSLPQDGRWGRWSEWSPCSVTCGTGYRKRERHCDSPPPRNGGLECIGDSIEIANCTNECDHLDHRNILPKNKSFVTEWLEVGGQSVIKKRYKMTCKAHFRQAHLKLSITDETEYCSEPDCPEEKEQTKSHAFTPWTECSLPCGGGNQTRMRVCLGENCHGQTIQTRKCNSHPCTGEWGCWSDWSPCNVSCGWGVETRYRKCLGHNCKGASRQERPCEIQSCDSLLGWGNWSGWSVCDKNNLQHRKRDCHTSHPSPKMCQGSGIETRMCFPDTIDGSSPMVVQATEPVSASAGVAVAYISVGFIIGLITGVGMMYWFSRRNKQVPIPSSPHYITAKQNPYISVPVHERPLKKHAATSSNILNNIHNGTLKSVKYSDYEPSTLKRNSNTLHHNGHAKQEALADDKFLYE